MKRNFLKLGLVALSLMVVLVANAQSEVSKEVSKEKKKKKFALADTNMDGKLSTEEYNKYRVEQKVKKGKEVKKQEFTKRFKEIDVDKDGFISKEEFKNRKSTKTEKEK